MEMIKFEEMHQVLLMDDGIGNLVEHMKAIKQELDEIQEERASEDSNTDSGSQKIGSSN